MLSIIKSFHGDIEAIVRVGDADTHRFEVRDGLRQGCTMAPTLFNAMVSVLCDHCDEVGIPVLYKHGRRLIGD